MMAERGRGGIPGLPSYPKRLETVLRYIVDIYKINVWFPLLFIVYLITLPDLLYPSIFNLPTRK
jgi:hypothetical protein